MFSMMRAATGLLTLSSMLWSVQANPLNALARRQDYGEYDPSCGTTGGTVIYISTNVVSYPVVINQYFESNTNFIIDGGVTINIYNAPTYLDTTVTVTTTSTTTSTQTTTTTATAVPTGGTFVIAVTPALTKDKAKRQSGGFLAFVGGVAEVVTDKGSASEFSASGGFLFSGGEYVGLSNLDLAAGFGAFQLSSGQPDVAITWTAVIGGAVTFSNGAFAFGGFAEFCVATSGSCFIEATSSPSFECLAILLTAELPSPSTSSSTTGTITSSVTSSTSTSSTSTTSDTSADMNVPDPTTIPRARSMVKKADMNGAVRRGGFYRSPHKA